MEHGRRRKSFVSLPLFIGLASANPPTAFQFAVASYMRLLLGWAVNEKEPCVEAFRCKRRRHPTPDKGEVFRFQSQAVMTEQFRPRHSPRLEIIQHRSSLPDRQGFGAPREQHPCLFKHLARRATDHCGPLRIVRAVCDPRFGVRTFCFSTGKRIEPAEKDKL